MKIGDKVLIKKSNQTAVIDNILNFMDNLIVIVKYSNGEKDKLRESDLMIVNEFTITTDQFDKAVEAVMYATAEDLGDSNQLDNVLEIIGAVGSQIKARLFNGDH